MHGELMRRIGELMLSAGYQIQSCATLDRETVLKLLAHWRMQARDVELMFDELADLLRVEPVADADLGEPDEP